MSVVEELKKAIDEKVKERDKVQREVVKHNATLRNLRKALLLIDDSAKKPWVKKKPVKEVSGGFPIQQPLRKD